MQKPTVKGGKCKKPTVKAAVVAKRPAAAGAAPAADRPRSVHVEASISSVLARTGFQTKPKSMSFPYKGAAGLRKAKVAAERWLQSMGV